MPADAVDLKGTKGENPMTATAARIIAEPAIRDLADANPHYACLTEAERFWYRMAMLDAASLLISDVMGCEDLDQHSVGAAVDALHQWHQQLLDLHKALQ